MATKKTYVKDINSSNITDWQKMMFGELPPDILEKAKADFVVKPDKYVDEYGEAGTVTKKLVKGTVTPPKGVQTVTKTIGGEGDTEGQTVTTYKKDLGTVNGLHLVARYDDRGQLTGFDEWRKTESAPPVSRVYADDKQYLYPKWDATGKAVQAKGYETKGGGLFSDFFDDVTTGFDDLILQNPALRAFALSAAMPSITEALSPATTTTGGAVDLGTATGADLSAAYDIGPVSATTAAPAATTAATTGGGLLSNAAADAQFIAADAAQLASQGLSSGQIAQTLAASGVDSFVAADVAQLAAQGLDATQIASTVSASLPSATSITGGGGLFTEGGAAAGGAAATTAATTAADAATKAAAAGAGAGAASTLTDAALLKGGLSLVGGLLQGETASDAANTLATNQAKLAAEVKDMGKFQPVGITTRFGTSSFTTDPVTGAITPSYTLSPEAQAYQDQLAGIATSGLEAGKGLMSLGQQYVGESPEAVRQRYISTQQALLAPQQEQTLAALRANQMNTGRGGLAFGATSDGLAATNPEMAAYYNSLAQTQRQLAANAETQYQNQVNFGAGLMGQATTPFTNAFTAQKSVEAAGQAPLTMSTDFAKTAADIGIRQGANYANAMAPSLQSSYKASATDPWATFLQGLSDSDLAIWGLSKIKP